MSYLKSICFLVTIVILTFSCKSKTENTSSSQQGDVEQDTIESTFQNATTSGTVLLSSDFGKTWQVDTTGLPSPLKAFGIEKLGTELVIATKNDGLFMTENNGDHWKDISNGLATKKINTFCISGDELYLGLNHEGVTMWKLHSNYWNSYNSGLPNRNVLAIAKVKDELVVGNDNGIFKSADKRQSWNAKYMGEPVTCLQAKGDTLFAGSNKGVMISKDGGENWIYIRTSGRVHGLALIDHFLYVQFASGELYRTDNLGANWQKINFGANDHTPVYVILKINDQYLLSHRKGIFISNNGETMWKLVYPTQWYWFEDLALKGQTIYGITGNE